MRSIIIGASIWVLLAGAAVVGVFSVLSGIGSGTDDSQPHALSQRDISRELASPTEKPDETPSGTADETDHPTHSNTPRDSDRSKSPAAKQRRSAKQLTGGTVVASCKPGGAYLESWSPAPGFDSDDVHRGPAHVASIEFEGDDMPDYLVTVRCKGGSPTFQSIVVDD